MKVEKTITDGIIKIRVNNKKIGQTLSMELTGTTQAGNYGVFSGQDSVYLNYGDFNTSFSFRNNLKETFPVKLYAENLLNRIEEVKQWIAKCNAGAGTIEVEDNLNIISEKLEEEGRSLYFRNKKGQIQKLN